jgi:A/G-specific adenine glycosylase
MKKDLLAWYDDNRRELPWRAKPFQSANPYHVYLSEILLQQTTVPTVMPYFERFIQRWPTLKDFACASLHDVLHEFQGLGYYSRAKNLHKAAKLLTEKGGIPDSVDLLLTYPGIGDYTAKAIASIAYDKPVIPIDGNVIRVISRFFGLKNPLPNLKKDVLEKTHTIESTHRPGDFAQALMDFGSIICKPKNPQCHICPLQKNCVAFKENMVLELPARLKKEKTPRLYATAFIYENGRRILLEKNPNEGLLANLWGVPTTVFSKEKPLNINDLFITHVFTHFHLTLYIKVESRPESSVIDADNQQFVDIDQIRNFPLSTLMKKVLEAYKKIRYYTSGI